MPTIYTNLKTSRGLRKKVSRPGGGYTSEPNGIEDITYAVDVDMSGLALLACKAAGNKSQKSSMGPLTVRIVGKGRRA